MHHHTSDCFQTNVVRPPTPLLPFLLLLLPFLQLLQVFFGHFDDVRGLLLGGRGGGGEGARAPVERLPVGGAGQVLPQVLIG